MERSPKSRQGQPLLIALIPTMILLGGLGCGSSNDPSPGAGSSHLCVEDGDCEGGACVENACVPHACTEDEDCQGGACVENACVPHACTEDEDCQGGACVENACVSYPCTKDEDCEGGACFENACVPHGCTKDEDCEGGSCVENACVPHDCTEDEDCEGGSCVENACAPNECTEDEDCEGGVCLENTCVPHGCTEDEDCEGGSCVENACVPYECTEDGDCEEGACLDNACVPHECTEDEDCEDGGCFENACVPYECTEDGDCEEGACLDNACIPHECTEDEDCEEGVCVENACVPYECSDDASCRNGLCREHFCVDGRDCILGVDVDSIEEAIARYACEAVVLPEGTFDVRGIRIQDTFLIRGAGSGLTILDAGQEDQHFTLLRNSALSLDGLTLRGGVGSLGGSIHGEHGSRLAIDDVSFEGNQATERGGAIYMTDGTVTGTNCKFSDNHVFTSGPSSQAIGGGAMAVNNSDLSLMGCHFERNSAVADTSLETVSTVEGGALAVFRVGVNVRNVHLEDTTFEGNWVTTLGDKATLRKGGAMSIDGGKISMHGVDIINNRGALAEDCGSRCGTHGGGAYIIRSELSMSDFRVAGNTIEGPPGVGLLRGGGLFLSDISKFHLRDGVVEENTLENGRNRDGGGILVITSFSVTSGEHVFDRVRFLGNGDGCPVEGCVNGESSGGGAVYYQIAAGTIDVSMDRVVGAGNFVQSSQASGGFLMVNRLLNGNVSLKIQNSTFSENAASYRGSFMRHLSSGGENRTFIQIFNTTIVSTQASSLFQIDGANEDELSRFVVGNSILSGERTCHGAGPLPFESFGWTVHAGDPNCTLVAAPTDLIMSSVELLPLADNGGETLTHALEPMSDLRGAGEPGGCRNGSDELLEVDQRGVLRTTSNCTPGAYSD